MSQTPLLRRAGLTGRVVVITKYRVNAAGMVTAIEKHDVTAQYEALACGQPSEQQGRTDAPANASQEAET